MGGIGLDWMVEEYYTADFHNHYNPFMYVYV